MPYTCSIYFCWFKSIPDNVPLEKCISFGGLSLLYIGISPDKKGKPASKANIRTRIKAHYQGNAEGSTLRRTLGVLLSDESNYPLRRVGSGRRFTFTHSGEQWLDQWMQNNAFVSWVQHNEPWQHENELIKSISLPLNIQGNLHSFRPVLTGLRARALQRARETDIADESATQRRFHLP